MRQRQDTGSFAPGGFESQYEELFAEALGEGSGAIAPEERERLNLAAAALGLDAARMHALEAALRAAYDARAALGVADAPQSQPGTLVAAAYSARPSTVPPPPPLIATTPSTGVPALRLPSPSRPAQPVRTAPIDGDLALHARYDRSAQAGRRDAQWCTAAVLVHRGAATSDERAFWEAHRASTPPRPTSALTVEAYADLYHPDEDRTVGEILGLVASAVLLGRISAMRRDRVLPTLDPKAKQDPSVSTVSAVRAIGWAAALMGMQAPPIFVAPDRDVGLEIVTAMPPATRVGKRALAGRSAAELGFLAARHLMWFRAEHFVCALVPSIQYLEDVFVAALSLGADGMDLMPDVRARIAVVADAIRPVLDGARIAALKEQVARFLGRGGRTSLRRWARAAELTSCRAGLLVCGDLAVASGAIAGEPGAAERIADLEAFWASDAASRLRQHLGFAVT
jgi:hypothetical protein